MITGIIEGITVDRYESLNNYGVTASAVTVTERQIYETIARDHIKLDIRISPDYLSVDVKNKLQEIYTSGGLLKVDIFNESSLFNQYKSEFITFLEEKYPEKCFDNHTMRLLNGEL